MICNLLNVIIAIILFKIKFNDMIKFRKNTDQFYKSLKKEVNLVLTKKIINKAKKLLWMKFTIYLLLFILSIVVLYFNRYGTNTLLLTINYIFIGQAGILLAFNSSHDAVHNTFSKHKKVNAFIYHLTFNLQGINARLWKIRHLSSHHVFPNVDGCDADIDDNAMLRLSPTHKKHYWHKFQHIYAPLLYAVYTLHWILVKDFVYLKKKNLANLKNQKHSIWVILELFLWKAIYFGYMILLPLMVTEYKLTDLLLSFVIMHLFISLFFVFTLIISHLCAETEFPVTNKEGYLPYNYYKHQLAVSLDYHPTSRFANWIFGGFNAHAAHHLFPKLPHTCYTVVTKIIKQKAKTFNYPYNELNILKAIKSHFKYLKNLGKA